MHLRPIKIDDSVDVDLLARQTPGFSGLFGQRADRVFAHPPQQHRLYRPGTGKAKPSVSVTEQSYLRNLISVSTSYILLLPYRVSIAVRWLSVKHLLSSRVPVIVLSLIHI